MPPLRGWTCGRWSLLLPPQFHKSSSHTSSLEKEAHLATRSSPQGGTNLAQDVGPGNRFLLYGESLQGRYPIAELPSPLVNNLAADDCRHNFSAEAPTVEGSVLRLGARLRGIEGPLLPGIEDGDVGVRTFCKRASASKPKDLGGIRGQQLDNPPQRQLEMLIQNSDGDGQRGLKAGDAEGGTLELDLLLVEGVRRVVGGYRVDGPVDDALHQSVAVGDRAQWRIHLVVGVEVADILIHQREMVGRNFGGDAKPCFLGAANFVSVSPRLPAVAAAMGKTFTSAPRSGARIQRVISAESFTGTVLGMAQTEVNPPAAAAAVPVALVSLWACPGSRRCTCRSMKPGATMHPFALKLRLAWPRSFPGAATAATRPSRRSTSISWSTPPAGSTTCPRAMSNESMSFI